MVVVMVLVLVALVGGPLNAGLGSGAVGTLVDMDPNQRGVLGPIPARWLFGRRRRL